MFRNQLLASSAAGVLALTVAGVSHAQSTEQAVTVDEIIVTGEKTDRSLQDTPASVAVTTARRVEQEAIQTLAKVFQRTANVSETYGHQGFTIRGVNNQGVSGGGDAALTTLYVDGAPLPSIRDRVVRSTSRHSSRTLNIESVGGPGLASGF